MAEIQTTFRSELVGVFGHPVDENPTVVMHEAAYEHLGLNWRYLTIDVLPDGLGPAIAGMRAMNFRGINLTIPHKVTVIPHLDSLSEAAELMGAVNVVVRRDGELHGENTDGKGFLKALVDDGGVDPSDARVTILGAGGAARAIAIELALAGVAQLTVVNRTAQRGRELADAVTAGTRVTTRFLPWKAGMAVPEDTDILVNATSIGMSPDVEARPPIDYSTITARMIVCDAVHTPLTPFLERASEQGAKTLDGLGMLVYQGAITFELWTGESAPVDVMHAALSSVLES